MKSDYTNSNNNFLSPSKVQSLQKCADNRDSEGFKQICKSIISDFHLYAQGKASEWNKLVGYIEDNFPGIYPNLVTDSLIEFLFEQEFRRQSSSSSIQLLYPLSNASKYLIKQENIENKVAKAIESLRLEDRPIDRYQDFLSDILESDLDQAMEAHHFDRFLKAIDCAEKGNYNEASALFSIAFNTAPIDAGKRFCQISEKAANDACIAYENALANAASETKAKEIAHLSWNNSSQELSVYLNFLGVYLSEREKYLEAFKHYDKAIKINPSHAMTYLNRGGTKAVLGLYDEAIHDLQVAEKIFYEQGDLTNAQNARDMILQIESLNSSFTQREISNNHERSRALNLDQAAKNATAQIYSLNNTYLSEEEKLEVAMWYSLPGNLLIYTFLATAIYSTIYPLNWFYLFAIPLTVNLISGLINWFFYSRALMNALYMTVLHSLIMLIFRVAGMIFLILNGSYVLGIVIFLSLFGLLTPFELHIVLYSYLSGSYNMSPQYAFFKRFYGFKFPFEEAS